LIRSARLGVKASIISSNGQKTTDGQTVRIESVPINLQLTAFDRRNPCRRPSDTKQFQQQDRQDHHRHHSPPLRPDPNVYVYND
ncbi:unnamed protein product, partial [Ectocarpus sp. 6 AP-2014]